MPDDGSGHSHNHDGNAIASADVQSVCVGGARCCYRKHCPNGVCVGFCLRRPNDPYFVSDRCPAWTDGIEAWYVQGVYTGTAAPRRPPPAPSGPPPSPRPATSCPTVYTPTETGGGPTDDLYSSEQAATKCSVGSRCCYYLHCPNDRCVFCLYSPFGDHSPNLRCPKYDGTSNLYNVPGILGNTLV